MRLKKNPAYLVECAVAIMVRNAFSSSDYAYIAKETMQEVFLTADPQALASVRHLCVYFRDYFSAAEWEKVIARLFKNQQEYLRITATTRQNDHLHKMLHSGSREAKELMNIATVYRDAAGKKHRFTIKDADPCYSVELTTALLSILTSLTIFERNGVRRFTELVRYIYHPTTPVYDSEQELAAVEEPASEPTVDATTVLQPYIVKALALLSDLDIDKEEEAGIKKYWETNVYAGKTPAEMTAYLLEDFELPETIQETDMLDRILTAFVNGERLKDAQPEFALKDLEEKTKNKSKQKNKKGKNSNSKRKSNSQNTFETAETIRKRREERDKENLFRKATGKKKRGKKKR